MLQNSKFTAFSVSELLRDTNKGKISPTTQIRVNKQNILLKKINHHFIKGRNHN